jgi:hypothetical protein
MGHAGESCPSADVAQPPPRWRVFVRVQPRQRRQRVFVRRQGAVQLRAARAVVRGTGAVRPIHPVARSRAGLEFADGVQRTHGLAPGWRRREEARRRGAEGLDAGRNLGQRVEAADQTREFLLGAVFGECEDLDEIVGGQVGTQHQQPGEVEFTCGNGIEQCGKAAHEASRADAAERFVFGETQLVNTIRVQARASAGAMDPARFDLGEVREQARQQLVRATDEPACGGQ